MTTNLDAGKPVLRGTPPLRGGWLSNRRLVVVLALGIAGTGAALNWSWLTAIGVAPILISLAPCAAMCALGLCMRGGGAKACAAPKGDAADGSQPLDRRE